MQKKFFGFFVPSVAEIKTDRLNAKGTESTGSVLFVFFNLREEIAGYRKISQKGRDRMRNNENLRQKKRVKINLKLLFSRFGYRRKNRAAAMGTMLRNR